MSFLKGLAKLVTKDIPKATGKVANEIGDFVTEDAPDGIKTIVKQKELKAEVKRLRSANEKLLKHHDRAQERFFETSRRFIETRAKYQSLRDDYAKLGSSTGIAISTRPPVDLSRFDTDSDFEKTLKNIGEGARSIVAFVSFDLTELIFKPFELAKERDHLKEQNTKIASKTAQITASISHFEAHIARMHQGMAEVETELKARGLLGEDHAGDKLRLEKAQDQHKLEMAQRMLADGLDPAVISKLVGLPEASFA